MTAHPTPEQVFLQRLEALLRDARAAARYAYVGSSLNFMANQNRALVPILDRDAGFWNTVMGLCKPRRTPAHVDPPFTGARRLQAMRPNGVERFTCACRIRRHDGAVMGSTFLSRLPQADAPEQSERRGDQPFCSGHKGPVCRRPP
jgi:hypothetical protein